MTTDTQDVRPNDRPTAVAWSDWPAELRLLLACASASGSPLTELTDLVSAAKWEQVLQAATDHGLLSLLHSRLSALPPSALSGEKLAALEQANRSNVQNGLRLTAVLYEVMELLDREGLMPLPYKGPSLSAQLFADAAVREAVDLDVLVAPSDAPRALAVLQRSGFQPARRYAPAVVGQLFAYRAEIGLVRDGVLLELQWRLAPKYFSDNFNLASAWERRGRLQLGARVLNVMSDEDNLLALCIHGTKHQWEKLKWVVDVDRLIRRHPALDWEMVASRAEGMGVRRILLTSLCLIRELLATPLPREIAEVIASDAVARRLTTTFSDGLRNRKTFSEAEHHRLMLTARERRRDRVLYRLRLAYQPTEFEWDAAALPQGLQWLYYGMRVGRVAAKWAGRVAP